MPRSIERLIDGIRNFSEDYCQEGSMYCETVDNGQRPRFMIVGCCDSMVDPQVLTHTGFGEIFVHRNIAALVPPCGTESCTAAALQHGVENLEVDHLIVLGHGRCGGIQALRADKPEDDSAIHDWVKIAEGSVDKSASAEECEKASILMSLKNCETYPWVQRRLKKGLKIHGWYFSKGNLEIYDHETSSWKALVPAM